MFLHLILYHLDCTLFEPGTRNLIFLLHLNLFPLPTTPLPHVTHWTSVGLLLIYTWVSERRIRPHGFECLGCA